jgi:hypothetical protein
MVPTPCMRKTYISVVNGRNMKPRHGRMNVLKVAFIIAGRAIHTMSSMMREKLEMKAVKHPELLLDLIVIPFPFQDRDSVGRICWQ